MEFHYEALNAQGNSISGQINATSEREATRLLRQQELIPLSIAPAQGRATATAVYSKSAKPQDKVLLIRELATLLKAHVPLAEAVAAIGEGHAGTFVGKAFSETLKALQTGSRLSQALEVNDLRFPGYLYQLVAAGEMTGKLAQSMETAATQMEYEERMRQEMRNALTYPVILVLSGIAATLLVFVVVVPKFANLIKAGRSDVPLLSQWVIGAGLFVQQNLMWVGLGSAAAFLAALMALSNPVLRARAFEVLSRVPVLGGWIVETETGRWAAMLGALLENRVPIISAMDLAQQGVRLMALQSKLEYAVRQVRAGKKLADALADTHALSVTGLNLVRVGERSGEVALMLRALAELHENAARDRMKRFMLLLEPIAILLIGSIIGTIMIAIMLAITSLSTVHF